MRGKIAKIGVALGTLVAADLLVFHVITPRGLFASHEHGIRKVDADLFGIKEALELFHRDCGLYPADLESLVANNAKGVKCNGTYDPRGYLYKVPVDPWGRPYVFLSDGRRYLIASYGADGQRGGRGNDAGAEIRNF